MRSILWLSYSNAGNLYLRKWRLHNDSTGISTRLALKRVAAASSSGTTQAACLASFCLSQLPRKESGEVSALYWAACWASWCNSSRIDILSPASSLGLVHNLKSTPLYARIKAFLNPLFCLHNVCPPFDFGVRAEKDEEKWMMKLPVAATLGWAWRCTSFRGREDRSYNQLQANQRTAAISLHSTKATHQVSRVLEDEVKRERGGEE